MNRIDSFTGDYRWLSNFFPCDIKIGYNFYPSVEHAYQALKTLAPTARERIRLAPTPGQAKKLGRTVELRPNWEAVKLGLMKSLLRLKYRDPALGEALVATHPALLVEGNTWGDTFWGVCNGTGQNYLGLLTMEIREELLKLRHKGAK